MARRWKIAFSIGIVIFALVYSIRLIRFYRDWYGMPVTLHKILSANLGYMRGDWPNLLFGALIVVGMATNWAIERKRASQVK